MDPARLLSSAAIVFLLTLTLNTANKNSGLELQALQSRIRKKDHVALVTCNGFWNFSNFAWIQQFSRPRSHWAIPNLEFHDMLESNIYNNVKTVVVVPEHARNVATCLEATFNKENSFYLVDWIMYTRGGQIETSMEHATRRIYGRSLACRELDKDSHITGDSDNALIASGMSFLNLYSLECSRATATKEVRIEPGTTLRNSFIRVACYHPAFTKQPNACYQRVSQLILRSLNFYNATLSGTLYLNLEDIFTDFSKGNVDILVDMCVVADYALRRCSFSPPVLYTYETFYARRGTRRPVSLFHIIMQSNPAFYLLIVALVSAFLVLGTADILEFLFTSIATTLDMAMFLIASFYATSSPIPYTRRWNISRSLVYGVWLVAILPLSNYIRSELTSRLTWFSPPESLDSLDELMAALDAGKVSLCVIAAQAVKEDLECNYTGTALHAKLQSLYMEQTMGTELVKNSSADCITCASMENHICLADRISSWCPVSRRQGINIVQCTERLKPLFGASPIRKNYPLSRAYEELVRRLFESPIMKPPHVQDEQLCSNEEGGEPKSQKIQEFALFFLYFFGFLGTAAAALVIEILVCRCQNQKLCSDAERLRLRQDQRRLTIFAKTRLGVRRRRGLPSREEGWGLPQSWTAPIRNRSGRVILLHVRPGEPLTQHKGVTTERDTWMATATTAAYEQGHWCRAYRKAPRPKTK